MNRIFFLICLLALGSSLVLTQQVYADPNYFRGLDYSIQNNFDGSITKTIGLPPFIYDYSTGQYTEHLFTNGTSKTVETNHGSVILDDNGLFTFYDKGQINRPIYNFELSIETPTIIGYENTLPLFTDVIFAKVADINNPNMFNRINALNDKRPDVSFNPPVVSFDNGKFESSKIELNQGHLKYRWIQSDGKWKTELEITNLGNNPRVFGFDQVLDLKSDTITINGQTLDIDLLDGIVYEKDWLLSNNAQVIIFDNSYYFDFDIAFPYLNSITLIDTGVDSSRLIFDYRMDDVLPVGETLILDPTFGDITFTNQLRVTTSTSISTSCPTPVTINIGGLVRRGDTVPTQECDRMAMEFNISSFPINAQITNVNMTSNKSAGALGINCDFNPMTTDDLSTLTAQQLWDDIGDGTSFLSNNAYCTTLGIDTIDLGSGAVSDLQSALGSSSWAFGVKFTNEVKDGTVPYVWITVPTISVTYNLPPDPPKQFAGYVSGQGVVTTWSAGELNGDTHSTYEVERLNEDGVTWDQLVSQSGTGYTDPLGIDNGTAMYRAWDTGALGRGCSQPLLNSTLIPNLISHFPLCYTTNDNGVLDNDGTVTGNELYTNSSGIISFDFDGSSYTTLPNESDYDYDYTQPKSFVFEIKTTSAGASDYIIQKGETGGTFERFLVYLGSGTMVFLEQNATSGYNQRNSLTTNYNDGSWHHVAITSAGTSGTDYKIYKDGVDDTGALASNTLSSSILTNRALTLGADYSGGNPFTGELRNIMIFNSTLTAHDIENIYNERIDTLYQPPPVDTITATVIDFNTVKLDITQPASARAISCYAINYTTPLGDPDTVYASCQTPADSFLIGGLDTYVSDYSFRLGTTTIIGTNASGTIANSTVYDPFAIGSVDITPTEDNLNRVELDFEEYQYTNRTDVKIKYHSSYNLSCDLDYKFARTNQTYTGLSETSEVDGPYNVYHNFTLNDPQNEIIDFYCWDANDPTIDGSYRVNQQIFPLQTQLQDFSNGSFGTDGGFGAIDLITLIAVIVSMIGFNRYNPAVGVTIMTLILGAMAWYEVIEIPTLIMGMIALTVVIAIIKVRND